jgi:hypothetical protein
MKSPNSVHLAPLELERALRAFKGQQQSRVIKGIHDNPGILTHSVCGSFYCNNIPDVAQKANPRLLNSGLKLLCTPQISPNKLTNSYHWYLCLIGEIEYFPTVKKAANDE